MKISTYFQFIITWLALLFIAQMNAVSKDILWANYGNTAWVGGLCKSDDGRYIACTLTADTSRLVVYDLVDDKEVWSQASNQSVILTLSPDGSCLGISQAYGLNSDIQIVDWRNNKVIFSQKVDWALDLYYSKDNKYLVVRCIDRGSYPGQQRYYIDVFDIKNKKKIKSVDTDWLDYLKFSDDNTKLFLSCHTLLPGKPDTNYIELINIVTGDILRKFDGNNSTIRYFDFSQAMDKIISVENVVSNFGIKIVTRDINNGSVIDEKTLSFNSNALEFRLSADHTELIIKQQSKTDILQTVNLANLQPVDTLYLNLASWFEFTNKNDEIIYCDWDNLYIRNIITKQTRKLYDLYTGNSHTNYLSSISISPDNKYVASAGADAKIKIWDCSNGQFVKEFTDTNAPVAAIKFSPDGKNIMYCHCDLDLDLYIRELNTGNLINTYNFKGMYITSPKFSDDGNYLYFLSYNEKVFIFDIQSDRFTDTISLGCQDALIDLSKSNRLLVASCNELQGWEKSSGGFIKKQVDYNLLSSISMDISPIEDYVASYYSIEGKVRKISSWKDTLYVSNECIDLSGKVSKADIDVLKFSPDAKYLYASIRERLKVYDIAKHNDFYIYLDSTIALRHFRDIAVSEDGKILITALNDGSVIRWRTQGITDVPSIRNDKPDLTIYPNPASDIINFKSEKPPKQIIITDLIGRVTVHSFNQISANEFSIDISGFSAGTYLLSIKSGNDLINRVFIRE